MVVLYSVFIHIVSIISYIVIDWISDHSFGSNFLSQRVTDINGTIYVVIDHDAYSVFNYIVSFPLRVLLYLFLMVVVSVLVAFAFRVLARYFRSVGRLLFGPLAPILSDSPADLLTCFVLTKIQYQNRRMIYAGYPIEVNLKDGSNIDHIVLENPEKFYLRLNTSQPISSYDNARTISTLGAMSLMYISGRDIENVHFEGWAF
jgi:hypothetical protein